MNEDEMLRRLRSVDPARGRHPDLTRIRRQMPQTPLSLTGSGTSAPGAAATADDTAVDMTGPGSGRRLRTVAGIAAALAISLGTGGYLLGSHHADSPPSAGEPSGQTSPTLATVEAPEDVDTLAEEGAGAVGIDDVGISADATSRVGAATSSPWAVLTGSDALPTDAPGPAEIDRVRHEINPETALVQLTTALGAAEGELEVYEGYASLTTDDFSYSVSVNGEAQAMVSAQGPWSSCAEVGSCAEDEVVVIGEDEAIAELSDMLAAADLDPADFEFLAQTDEFNWVSVVAVPQTDLGWLTLGALPQAEFVDDALVSATIPLPGSIDSLGEYDLLSPAEAVQASADPRRREMWLATPLSAQSVDIDALRTAAAQGNGDLSLVSLLLPAHLLDQSEQGLNGEEGLTGEEQTGGSGPAAGLSPDGLVSLDISQYEIVSTTLSRAAYQGPDGITYIIPAYIGHTDSGDSFALPAVTDDALEFTR